MKSIKCYGRNKVATVKLEKSMVRRFFDGSSLNCSSSIYGRTHRDQGESTSFNENIYDGLPSIHLFQKSNFDHLSKNEHSKTNAKKTHVATSGAVTKGKKKTRKKILKLKNLNTEAANNQYKEPHWSEINNYEFVLEKLGKTKKVKVPDSQNFIQASSSNSTPSRALTRAELFSDHENISKPWEEKSFNSLENVEVLEKPSESLHKSSGLRQNATSKSSVCFHNASRNKSTAFNSDKDLTVSYNSRDLFDSSSETPGSEVQDKVIFPTEQSMNRVLRSPSYTISQNCESVYCGTVGKIAFTSTPLIKSNNALYTLFNPNLVLSPLIREHRNSFASLSQSQNSGCSAPISKSQLSSQKDPSHAKAADLSNHNLTCLSLQFKEKSSVSQKVCSDPQNTSQAILSRILSSSTQDLSSVIQDPQQSDELTKKDLLGLCNQEEIVSFNKAYKWGSYKIKKIGEGTYGEVFMISKKKTSSVLKIIPVSQNDDNYQNFKNVLSEVKISKCLSDLRKNKINHTKSFIKMNRVSMVCGEYPHELIYAWDAFGEEKSTYNARPDIFDENQVFIILDLEYGGKDLSCFVLRDASEAESVLKQIAVALAVAEEAFLFEHRDLHLGNILIQRNKSKTVSFKLRGENISFESHGLHVTLIDFTLSRLHEDGYVFYYDLANDVSLFNQSGDIQFEVYRKMKEHLRNQWQECVLYSNVLWLNFLCVKLLEFDYSRPSNSKHKNGLSAIINFQQKLNNNNSALECLETCGISSHGFQFDINRGKNSSKNSILVSRNSYRK